MLADKERVADYNIVEARLLQLVNGGLEYFLQLTSEVHREAWTSVLLLIFVQMLQLQSQQVFCEHYCNVDFVIQDKVVYADLVGRQL